MPGATAKEKAPVGDVVVEATEGPDRSIRTSGMGTPLLVRKVPEKVTAWRTRTTLRLVGPDTTKAVMRETVNTLPTGGVTTMS